MPAVDFDAHSSCDEHGAVLVVYSVNLSNGYVISDDRARLDMEFVHAALADAYWAIGRPRALTERSWANCLCFGLYAPDSAQAGCARVLTDYTFRAHLADLVIGQASRGNGLGKSLVETILLHPELVSVSQWTLATADAQALYYRYGFRTCSADSAWMTLVRTPPAVIADLLSNSNA